MNDAFGLGLGVVLDDANTGAVAVSAAVADAFDLESLCHMGLHAGAMLLDRMRVGKSCLPCARGMLAVFYEMSWSVWVREIVKLVVWSQRDGAWVIRGI